MSKVIHINLIQLRSKRNNKIEYSKETTSNITKGAKNNHQTIKQMKMSHLLNVLSSITNQQHKAKVSEITKTGWLKSI